MVNRLYEPKVFYLYGYSFHSDGTVYNKNGKKLTHRYNAKGTAFVVIRQPVKVNTCETTKQKKIAIALFIYRNYHGLDHNKRILLGYKDGNKANCDINNLYETTGMHLLSKGQVDEIRASYKNKDRHFNNTYNKDSPSIRDLAKKYEVSVNVIQRVLKGDYLTSDT